MLELETYTWEHLVRSTTILICPCFQKLNCTDDFFFLKKTETEEEAAEAYDIAAIEIRGKNAVTNFDRSNYVDKGMHCIEGEGLRLLAYKPE